MKAVILFISLVLVQISIFSQCIINPVLNSVGGNCSGIASLRLTGTNNVQKIVWYRNDIQVGYASTFEGTVSGGNGQGSVANQFNYPSCVCVDAGGIMYICDKINSRVQKWAPGAVEGITVAGGNGSGDLSNQLSYPDGIFVDLSGNIYVSDNGNHRVQKWAPGSAEGITVAGGNGLGAALNQLNYPGGVFVDVNGNIFVADNSNHRIQKWIPGSASGITVAGGNGRGSAANQLDYPHNVYGDTYGNVYVIDNNQRVQKWAPGATSGITVAGGNGYGSASNQFNNAWGLFVDAAGNIFVADNNNHRVQKWAPGATLGITIAGGNGQGSASNQFNNPGGVFVDTKDMIYVCDNNNQRIQKWAQKIDSVYTPTSAGIYKVVAQSFNTCSFTTTALNIYPVGSPSASVLYNTYESNCLKTAPEFSLKLDKESINPSYQWFKNGSVINLATQSTYTSATLANNDNIKCRIIYNAGGCLTNDTSITDAKSVLIDPVYTFNGSGNWSTASNWLNGILPPADLQCCSKIIISPSASGECVVNTPIRIPSCVDFSVVQGKKIRVLGDLRLNYDSSVVLNDNVHIVDSVSALLTSSIAEIGQGIFKFTYSGTIPKYSAGDVLFGSTGDGYIRKISSLSTSGNTATFQTTQGNMEDVFRQGNFQLTTSTDASLQRFSQRPSGNGAYTYSFNDITLFQNGPVTLKLNNGTVTLDPNWNFDFDFSWSKLKYFMMSCKNATLNSNFQVDVNATGGFNVEEKSDTLKRVSRMFTINVPVYGVPVPVKVLMTLDFICKYSASIKAAVNTSFMFDLNNTMDLGIKYENSQWSPIFDFNTSNQITQNSTGASLDAKVNVAIIPTIGFKLYGFVGPYASLGLLEEMKGSVAIPSLDRDSYAKAWLRATLGINSYILGTSLFDYNKSWDSDTLTYESPYIINKISGDNQIGQLDQTLTQPVRVKVLDNMNNPEKDVPVYFKVTAGGGSVQTAMVKTDLSGYAETLWKLGAQTGQQTMTASAKKADGTYFKNAPVEFAAVANCSGLNLNVTSSGTTLTASASGGSAPYSYIWNKGAVSGSTFSDKSQVRNIEVTVTDANGCKFTKNDMCVGKAANLVLTPCTEQIFDYYLNGILVATLSKNQSANVFFVGTQSQTMIGKTTGVTHNYQSAIAPGQGCIGMMTCCPDAGTCTTNLCP